MIPPRNASRLLRADASKKISPPTGAGIFFCVGNVQQPAASNHQPTPHGRGAADAAPDSIRPPRHRAAASLHTSYPRDFCSSFKEKVEDRNAWGGGPMREEKGIGRVDPLSFACRQMANTRHDLPELAVGCWWLFVGHCRRAKNRFHKCHSRAFRGTNDFWCVGPTFCIFPLPQHEDFCYNFQVCRPKRVGSA